MINKIANGTQDFEQLRRNKELYIDKTAQIYKLLNSCSHFFLSKPRRFGKSLLLSTIRDIFMGKEELFEGLYIKEETDYDFEQFPVIYISFANFNTKIHNDNIDRFIRRTVKIFHNNEIYRISDFKNFDGMTVGSLIKEIYFTLKKNVVLLVDEYDKIV